MSVLLDAWSIVTAIVGLIFFAAGTAGVLRFPDPPSRLHAVTKADTLGLGFIALSLLPHASDPSVMVRVLLIWGAALLAAATIGPIAGRLTALSEHRP